MNKIDSFSGEYKFLSNFYPCKYGIKLDNSVYPSVEHAYQAAKTLDKTDRKNFLHCKPGEAKRLGKKLKIRNDWEKIKINLMYLLNKQKYLKDSSLKEKLLNTQDLELIEGNDWGDTFWGVYNNKGRNELGKILMKIRNELK